MHSFGDWLTGSDCMNDDKLMNDDSDESVSRYKNTPDKKMLYIVSIKKYPYYASIMLNASAYHYAQNYASIMCLSLIIII